ncbi:isochorismatase family protein [Glaciihabitans sp. UYNi722]|uniref:isochorismatase family protein n=1 Tax=Glaciihabitans sp. UYNi722 TaxID=3156344 RepID=UPI003392115F
MKCPTKEEPVIPVTSIDSTAALILVDLQKGTLAADASPVPIATVLHNARLLADAFRHRGLPIVLVNVAGRAPGRTDSSQAGGVATTVRPDNWLDIADELGAVPTDLRVTKSRWGAFHDTDLDAQLKGRGITQIVVGGIATSIGVESTARSATSTAIMSYSPRMR